MILWDKSVGVYATSVYLPFSALARQWRTFKNKGRPRKHLQPTGLPSVPWHEILGRRFIRLLEPRKTNGNVRISELGVLAQAAAQCRNGSTLFEIGTFDGRTTLNLAINSPPQCTVATLDLPQDLPTKFPLAGGESHFVNKPSPGERYRKYFSSEPGLERKIRQLLGDSARFDPGVYRQSCSLVFVDGSHAYDYLISDSRLARELIEPGGVIVWHDYGVWPDVTAGLEELASLWDEPLLHVAGTSLVVLRCTAKQPGNPSSSLRNVCLLPLLYEPLLR